MDELDEEAFQEFVAKAGEKAPWLQPDKEGAVPGDLCCMRSVAGRCYTHNPKNYFEKKP